MTLAAVVAITKWSIPSVWPTVLSKRVAASGRFMRCAFQPIPINWPPGGQWLREIKHDGCRAMARKQRRTERAYAPDSRYGHFPEEARHPSARNLPGRRDRAQRRLNNRPAAGP